MSKSTLVYQPDVGNGKTNKAFSILALVLIVGLLFVGMRLMSDEGLFQEVDVEWDRGKIDATTGIAVRDPWYSVKNTYGMYTKNAIPIEKGIRIELDYGSGITYQVLVYDENDKFLGALGDPIALGQKIIPDDFSGQFESAKFIRVYAYGKFEEISGINPLQEEFSIFDFWTATGKIKISNIYKSNFSDNLEDIT